MFPCSCFSLAIHLCSRKSTPKGSTFCRAKSAQIDRFRAVNLRCRYVVGQVKNVFLKEEGAFFFTMSRFFPYFFILCFFFLYFQFLQFFISCLHFVFSMHFCLFDRFIFLFLFLFFSFSFLPLVLFSVHFLAFCRRLVI